MIRRSKGGTGGWLRENRWIFAAFAVPMAIMWILFAISGVIPFGDHHIIRSDALLQYYPFLTQLREKLQAGESLFYTWNTSFGANFWALMAYYLLSPLNLLTVILPESWLPFAFIFFVTVKIGVIGMTCAIFLKSVFGRNDAGTMLFGCVYAFSSFFMGYYWNTMWLDAIAMLPLIALGVYALVKEGKFRLFTVSLALGIVFNYLIGIYLCIFTLLAFVGLCIIKKLPWKILVRRLCKIALCSAIAIGVAAIVLLPTYRCMANSARADAVFPSLTQLQVSLPVLLGRVCAGAPVTAVDGDPNLYCSVAAVLLVAVYIVSKRIRSREKICTCAVLLFLALSCASPFLEYLWNGFRQTYALPGRFSFLFCFVMVVAAYRVVPELTQVRGKRTVLPIIVGIILVCTAFAVWGKKVAVINGVLVLAYVLPVVLAAAGKLKKKHMTAIVSVVLMAEIVFGCYSAHRHMGFSDKKLYPENYARLSRTLDRIREEDAGFYRTAVIPMHTQNDPALMQYPGASSFSSLLHADQMLFLYRMGYPAHAMSNRSMYLNNASPLTNTMLNVKYLLANDTSIAEDGWLEKIAEDGDITAYKNTAALSVGFMTDPAMAETMETENNVMQQQNKIFRAMTGLDRTLFEVIEPRSQNYVGMDVAPAEDGRDRYVLHDKKTPGNAEYSYVMPREGVLYVYVFCNDIKDLAVKGEQSQQLLQSFRLPGIYCAGRFAEGEEVTLSWNVCGSGLTMSACAAVLDEEAFREGLAVLEDEQLQVEYFDENSLKGTIEVKQAGYFYTCVPYEEGWTVYVDGKETPVTPYQKAFVALEDLQPGVHTIEMHYMPPGFAAGAVITVASILAFALLCVVDKKRTALA